MTSSERKLRPQETKQKSIQAKEIWFWFLLVLKRFAGVIMEKHADDVLCLDSTTVAGDFLQNGQPVLRVLLYICSNFLSIALGNGMEIQIQTV